MKVGGEKIKKLLICLLDFLNVIYMCCNGKTINQIPINYLKFRFFFNFFIYFKMSSGDLQPTVSSNEKYLVKAFYLNLKKKIFSAYFNWSHK